MVDVFAMAVEHFSGRTHVGFNVQQCGTVSRDSPGPRSRKKTASSGRGLLGLSVLDELRAEQSPVALLIRESSGVAARLA